MLCSVCTCICMPRTRKCMHAALGDGARGWWNWGVSKHTHTKKPSYLLHAARLACDVCFCLPPPTPKQDISMGVVKSGLVKAPRGIIFIQDVWWGKCTTIELSWWPWVCYWLASLSHSLEFFSQSLYQVRYSVANIAAAWLIPPQL